MHKEKSTNKQSKLDLMSNAQWNTAIADSERLIGEYEEQIELLKGSIRSFKVLRDRGAPFPATMQQSENVAG